MGTLKRHGLLPSPQWERAYASPLPKRATTKNSRRSRHAPQAAMFSRLGNSTLTRAIPEASLEPCQYLWPEQSCTSTRAFFTGLPSDSRVTHTSEDSRPSLKCTLKLVTSVAART